MDIINLRLANQLLINSNAKTVKDVVSYMGAMQAQDFNMVKWGIGVRLPGVNEKAVQAAIDNGDVVRTHVMRPTWHLVAADDIRWMLALTAPKIKSGVQAWNLKLGIDEAMVTKGLNIIVKALEGNNHLTRDELSAQLQQAGIETNNYHTGHIAFLGELDGILCNGIMKGKKQTYALLDERAPATKPLSKEESLEKLARRYFTSHGPATLPDFVWWSGLSLTNARKAIELIKPDFISEKIGEQEYWFPSSMPAIKKSRNLIHLLPAFDEFIVSYKDRKEIITNDSYNKAISTNGVFRPTIMENGKVIGIWKRLNKKNEINSEPIFFEKHPNHTPKLTEKWAKIYNDFHK